MKKEITETLISFKVAELAKKKGFKRKVLKHDYFIPTYNKKGELIYKYKGLRNPNIILIANQSLLQKWLREKHNKIILIGLSDFKYSCKVRKIENDKPFTIKESGFYNTYEEALESGLFQALNLLPDKI